MTLRFYTNVQMIGNKFLVRGYENGKHVMFKEEYSPTLFVKSNKQTEYKTLEGECVESIQPGSVWDCRQFYKKYDGVENFKIYGNDRYVYQYISDKYPEDEIKFDISKIKLITLDIETTSENGFPDPRSCDEEILLITIQDYSTKQIITWGTGPFNNTQSNVKYIECSSEYDLLNKFMYYWDQPDHLPEVITGWNIQFFDIPYICGRLSRVLGEKRARSFSPWGLITQNEVYVNNRQQVCYDIGGITQLDYLDLYKKFTYKAQESYRLDYIAEVELNQKKLDHSEFDTFRDFYTKGWDKFVRYNIIDVELVDRLEDKMKLIELAITMAYDAKVNYADVFYQVRMWDNIIYNHLKKRNIVIPPKDKTEKNDKYAGAYVKEPVPGVYDWVVSLDLNSMYPHLIMMFNLSPETLLDEKCPNVSVDKILNKEIDLSNYKDYAVCPNGAMYRKDVKGILPELMKKMYNDRVIFKKKMIEAKNKYEKTPTKELEREISRCNNIQMAKKISLNSCYGSLGNQYFRYYKLENAEAITLSGQVAIRWIEAKLNKYMNKILKTEDVDYVIASDTDSIYLHMGPLVESVYKGREKTTESIISFLDKVSKVELEKYIEGCYQELAEYMNAYEQKMQMKRENIADRGIWTAKKRYIMNVWDSEGVRYSEPKLKIMGIEAVKSSTPAPCRKMIKDALKLMMSGTEDDVIKFIEKCRIDFSKLSPEEVSFPRSVNDLVKYKSENSIYEKGTPIAVRGALLFNYHIKEKKLAKKYSLIQNGEKIKFCYLRKPNPIYENVISFIQDFPKELNLSSYVDYDTQFEKGFLEPLKTILNAIGWNSEKKTTLDSFFV
jgi:DNA polymerase elongation subunit (family B)